MPQQDQHRAELHHAEEIGGVAFPSASESAEVFQPGKESFDFPATQVATQRSSVLGLASFASVRSDHFNAVAVTEPLIQGIAVVGFVADQSLRDWGDMSLRECVFDQP